MKKILIVVLVLASLILCSCAGDVMPKLSANKISLAFVSCSDAESYKSSWGNTVYPAEGNQFKKLEINLTNGYNESVYYSCSDSMISHFDIVLANGHKYSDESSNGSWTIMPESTTKVTIYFEIKNDETCNGAKLTYSFLDPDYGLYTLKTTINLGNVDPQ